MTALGTIRPGAGNTTGLPTTGSIIGSPGGSTALSDDSDATFDDQTTNSSGIYQYGRDLNAFPGDLGNVNTLLLSFRYAWQSAPSNSNWNSLLGRVVQSDGSSILAAASSGGLFQSFVLPGTTSTPTTTTAAGFVYVDTAASASAWDGAILQIQWDRTRNKGGDALGCRVYEAFITGDYTIATAAASLILMKREMRRSILVR